MDKRENFLPVDRRVVPGAWPGAKRRAWRHYVAAVLIVGLAAGVRVKLLSALGPRFPFITFFPAVMFAALYGGLWPGLLAAFLSALAATIWIEPLGNPAIAQSADWLGLGIFLLGCAAIAGISEVMHHARVRAAEADARARIAEERMRIVESSPDCIKQLDLEGRLLSMNPAGRRMMEIQDFGPFVGRNWIDFMQGDDRERTREAVARAGAGEVSHFQTFTPTFTHKPMWWDVSVSPILDGAGRPECLLMISRDVTARKQVEDVLQRYRLVVDHSRDIILFMRREDGRLLEVNTAATLAYGYNREEMLAMTIHELRTEETRGLIAAQMAEADAHGILFETIHQRKDGGTFPVEVSSRGTTLDGQRTLISVVRDITRRKQAKQKIQEMQDWLSLAQTASGSGAWDWDLVTGETRFSKEYCALFNLDPETCPPSFEGWLELIHPDDREKLRWLMDQLRKEGGQLEQEFRLFDSSQGIRWMLTKGRVLPDGEGRPVRMTGIVTDITERKRMEEALREREEQLRQRVEEVEAMMNVAPVAIWVAHDPQCHDITGNRMANQLYEAQEGENVSAGPVPGTHDRTRRFFCNGRELGPEELPMQKAAASGKDVRNTELEVWTPSGFHITILGSASPLRDADGRVRGCVGAFVNITDRKQAEDTLRETDRHKDEFLAMLAHELRNPLAPIRSAVHILRTIGSPEPATQRHHDLIERQVTHMARLLDDLLDVSRITHGKIELRRAPLRLVDILAHAVEAVMPMIEERNHEIFFSPPPEDLCIEGDADRLSQVVGNLLANAAKYTDEGGQIWLEARRENAQAIITVRDTGVGIAPEMLPRVFDLFTQAECSLDRSQGGLGIGLTMVRQLVNRHGGSVEAHSEGLGKGSEFVLRLPTLDEVPAPRTVMPATPEPAPARTGAPCRVLIVDDLTDSAQSLGELLEIWGHEVRTAHDGPAALEAARTFHPEVVLLDIGMPGMDGFEVARRLRQEQGQQIFLVALTGYGQTRDREATRAAGFDHHLVKPVNLAELRELIARIRV